MTVLHHAGEGFWLERVPAVLGEIMAVSPEPRLYWEDVQKQYTLDLAGAMIQKSDHLKRHPYFLWIQDPKLSQNAFRRSQVPFRFVTESHAQALAAVMVPSRSNAGRSPANLSGLP